MEHQQFYKMVAYEGSTRIPLVIAGKPLNLRSSKWVDTLIPTQLIDIFPTIMDFASVPKDAWPRHLQGDSLRPLIHGDTLPGRSFIISQYHGDDLAMSWYMVRLTDNNVVYKAVIYGTGVEVPPQLFNLTADPDEMDDLCRGVLECKQDGIDTLYKTMEGRLMSIVDYKAVSKDVAHYGYEMFNRWAKRQKDWRKSLTSLTLRWHSSYMRNEQASLHAILKWNQSKGRIQPCRGTLVGENHEQQHDCNKGYCYKL